MQSDFTVTHCYKISDIAATVHFMIFVRDIDTTLYVSEAFVSVFGFHDTQRQAKIISETTRYESTTRSGCPIAASKATVHRTT
jgi:hypothetical protein